MTESHSGFHIVVWRSLISCEIDALLFKKRIQLGLYLEVDLIVKIVVELSIVLLNAGYSQDHSKNLRRD